MSTQIFVNLPVKDLQRSVEFFGKLGYTFDPQYTDENATCMIIADNIFAMLLVKPFFESFISKPVADAHKTAEVILALSADNRAAVDALVDKAIAAGAGEPRPTQDLAFMYQRGFEDLDGHLWEVFHMSGPPPA
jgi:predicted lactoylglutathione lyase